MVSPSVFDYVSRVSDKTIEEYMGCDELQKPTTEDIVTDIGDCGTLPNALRNAH
jgi:hypothetical protein